MKQVIERKLYDTENAKVIAEYWNGYPSGDYDFIYEGMYLTANKTWFLYCKGGAGTKYCGTWSNARISGEKIVPLKTHDEVINWLEENGKPEVIIEHFPSYIEPA